MGEAAACAELEMFEAEDEETGSEREKRLKELQSTFSYNGYKVIRKELFAHLRDPALVIRKDSIAFNTACINGLEGVVYVHVMFNEDLQRIVVRGCGHDEKDALRWCVPKGEDRKSRKMNCKPFAEYVYEQLSWEKTCRYKILGYRIEYEGEALYIFDLKVPEIFEDRKRPRKKGQTFGERDNLGQVEQVEQTLPRKGFYAGDVANTFSVPVGVHQEETKFKQMDGYVSIGMLNGLKEELGSDQTVVEEINDLSEKPELQETAKKESESESGTQVDPAQETEELRKGQIYGNDTIHTVGG